MKKYKVFNNIFFIAGYSFSNLSMYYRHVVAQLQYYADGIKEAGKEREEVEKGRGREFDKQGQENFEGVFAEIWPGYFHNSFVVSACSLFEHQVKKLWAFIQEEHNVPFAWDDFRDPVPERIRKLLNFAGVTLKDNPPRIELPPPDFKPTPVYDENRIVMSAIWKELGYYYRVRNCIVHNNGLIKKARGPGTLQEYAIEKGVLVDREGQPEIQLNESFNVTVCETMGKFFDKLMGAYYSAPLPK